jgi:16S rRNA processing protein RimM
MDQSELFELGKVLKTFGSKGEVVVFLDVDNPEKYRKLDSVFIQFNQSLIPFFIENIQLKPKNQAVVKFHDVDHQDDAAMFSGCSLFLPLSGLPKLTGNQFYYHEIVGYEVIDKQKGAIGKVRRILELPHQAMFEIEFEDKEILIPVVDEIILKVDRKLKQLRIDAPEGLIDMYLE